MNEKVKELFNEASSVKVFSSRFKSKASLCFSKLPIMKTQSDIVKTIARLNSDVASETIIDQD